MSFYRGKLKRLIVLGGVALALLPCLQQTHALCRLAGCIDREELIQADVSTAITDSGGCCGSHKSVPCELPLQDQGDNSPCGPECQFAQPADPREAPRDSTGSVMSEILAACTSVTLNCAWDSHNLRSNWATFAFDDLPFTSSCETCARLCRFLT